MIKPIPPKRQAKEEEIRHNLNKRNLDDKPHHPFAYVLRALFRFLGLEALGELNTLKIDMREEKIIDSRIPSFFNGFKILFITDLHLNGHPILIRSLRRYLKNNDADIVLFGGDYQVNSYGNYKKIKAIYKELLRNIDCSNIYAVLGNHDEYIIGKILDKIGVKVLINESVTFHKDEQSLILTGIDDADRYKSHEYPKINFNDLQYRILLTHTPKVYESAHREGYHFLIAGHTHAGQVCLPGRIPLHNFDKFPHKLVYGRWNYKSMIGFTSAGVGNTWMNIRFFCPPEVVMFTLSNS